MKLRIHAALLSTALFASGCVEIQTILSGIADVSDGGSSSSGNDGTVPGDGAQNDGTADAPPEVVLTISNPNPTINEEVTLSCRANDSAQAVSSFAFQPTRDLVSVNPIAGTAVFIPSVADVGTEFGFTCTGTNDAGTGGPSPTQLVIPAG